ncbi:glycoside hydrolase family 3 N-terminal domain-containing protein [Anaerocolumna sp.]|uniref:glycoside hydrolase family 3 N-terminal domain-containing protein n=1 Tax=Anaerocolumna sp. TaxID=2041569 RepID=UPI0028AE93B5|nr:glycoside hydrolase family 3 N-terminal domain-containing protein [Anaerocolumna sp.]
MKKIYLTVVLFTALCMLSACNIISNQPQEPDSSVQPSSPAEPEPTQPEPTEPEPTQPESTEPAQSDPIPSNSDEELQSKAEQLLKNMTLKEKIGQLLVIRPEALSTELTFAQINDTREYGATEFNTKMAETLDKYPVGGVALFGKNIQTPSQLKDFINEMQQNSEIPLFVGIDEEGGSVSRVAKTPGFDVQKFESMEAVGKTKDPGKAREVGSVIGSYLKEYGFNLDFAPVADVNTNPDNIVIGNRSFGNDPNLVAEMITAEIEGLHKAGIMSSIKHFPGHGDTKDDTHSGFVSIEKNWEELKECELIPFKAGIDAQTDMIMISHITAENVTDDELPSSLSYEMIEGRLRKELNYDGVVITDSMSMGAIENQYSSGEAAVLAISAGADIVLMPGDFIKAFESIYDAVNNGTLSEERIDQSVLRILTLKEKYEILK